MKKGLKIFLSILLVIVVVLALIPLLFQDKIVSLVKENINNNVNAKVDFSDASLSLLRGFPNVSLKLSDVSVVNFKPFEGDTLFFGKEIDLNIKLTQLFKKTSEQLNIQSFNINDAKVSVLINKNGNANYDIAKSSKKEDKNNSNEKPTSFSINSYKIKNATIIYNDKKGKMLLTLNDFNHSGKGDFSAIKTELDTKTATNVSFEMENSKYVDNLYLDLNAVIDADLKNNKFSFLKNEAHINQLPLIFDGFVKLIDNGQQVNINFKTPSSDFKNFLALIPKKYAKNISQVKTTGDFSISGKVNGVVDDKHIPKIDVNINSNNASFKFPSLPKSVQNIHINTSIKNGTGIMEDTYVSVNSLSFKIDDNTFNGNAKIANLTTNPTVNSTLKGKLNLADIDKVYPIDLKQELSGIIEADIHTSFDLEAIKKNIYQRIKNNGTVSVNEFTYNSNDLVNPFKINTAQVHFQPTKINLTKFDAKTGKTDLKATGSLENFIGFLLANKKLKGNFNLTSNDFSVGDFMASETEKKPKKTDNKKSSETLKIPDFLDCTINATANKVHYDNLTLNNVNGSLIIRDQKATLRNLSAGLLGGNINLNGTVNTQNKVANYDMKLGINSFDISQAFTQMEMLKSIAPIAGVIDGKLNTNIDLKGNLKDDFTPDLPSMSGSALAQLLTQSINPEKSKAMNLLGKNLNFIDLKKLDLKDVKTSLSFKDGKVNVKPFNVKYKDVDIKIGGSHGFDKSMSYDVTFNVPAKYLGGEVSSLLSKLGSDSQNTTVPVTANLSGSFANPSIKTDLKSAVSNLTTQLAEKQKNKLINNTLGGLLGKKTNNSTKKSSNKNNIKNGVKSIFGGLLGKKKKNL